MNKDLMKYVDNADILTKDQLLKMMTLVVKSHPFLVFETFKDLRKIDDIPEELRWCVQNVSYEKTRTPLGELNEKIVVTMQEKKTAIAVLAKHLKVGEGGSDQSGTIAWGKKDES